MSLAEELALADWNRPSSARRPGAWIRVLIMAALGVLLPMFVLGLATDRFEPYQFSTWLPRAQLSVPVAALVGALLAAPVWLLCRRSVASIFGIQYLLVVVPYLAYRAVGAYDVVLDREPPARVTVRVLRHVHHVKGQDEDVVTSWRDPARTVNLSGFGLRAGAVVDLHVHRGALGLEWVSLAR